jgi:putative cell wall-binding protein
VTNALAVRARARLIAVGASLCVAGAGVAWGGIAAAFAVPSVATLAAGASVTLTPGVSSQSLSNLTFTVTHDATTSVWASGDRLTFELWDATAGSELSKTVANSFQSAALTSTPTLTSTSPAGAASLALARGGTSSVDDEFVLTFAADAPQDPATSVITISNLRVDLGANIPAGHQVQVKVVASNGTPFAGGSASVFVNVGAVRATTVTATPVVVGAPSATVALGTVRLTDLFGGSVNSGDVVLVALSGGSWVSAPARSGAPTISTVSGIGSATLSLTASATSTLNSVLTLSGGSIALPSSVGSVVVTIKDGATVLGTAIVASVLQKARVGGSDRYDTASLLFALQFGTTPNIVLTSGANYPDALSANYLAAQLSTGVLTTEPGSLTASTRAQLWGHNVTTVYLVGGVAAVSDAVVAQVRALHVSNDATKPLITVVRISGPDRYATNSAVDLYRGATSNTAIVATGDNFADALSAGPAVYRSGFPLVLTPSGSLSVSAMAALQSMAVHHVIILGGLAAVSSAIESALVAQRITVDYRIVGADRTQTAAQIAKWESGGLPATGIYNPLGSLNFAGTDRVYVARGDSFADALVAGAVAGSGQHALLLTTDPTTLGAGIPQYMAGRISTVHVIEAIGLQAAVSDPVLNAAVASLT